MNIPHLTPKIIFIILAILLAAINMGVLIFQNNPVGDSVYWTLCTLTWSTCEVDVLYTTEVKILSIIDGIATIAIILVMLYAFSEHILEINLDSMKLKKRAALMKNHYIVCGYGRVGKQVCDMLSKKNEKIIVIDRKRDIIEKFNQKNITGLLGDPVIDSKILIQAGIKNAKCLIVVLGSDADNISTVLSAKELNSNIKIAARAHNDNAVSRLKKAGAKIVVQPEAIGGAEIVNSINKDLGEKKAIFKL